MIGCGWAGRGYWQRGRVARVHTRPADPAAAFRDKLRAEQNLIIIFGSEIRGEAIAALVKFASSIPGAKLICLGDYANSRGAADMGLYPDLLPGYQPVTGAGKFHGEWGGVPANAGPDIPEMVESAKSGTVKGALRCRRESGGAVRDWSLCTLADASWWCRTCS